MGNRMDRTDEVCAQIVESLAVVVDHAARIKAARELLAGEGGEDLFDADIFYDKTFARAVEDLAYAAYVAERLNPIKES